MSDEDDDFLDKIRRKLFPIALVIGFIIGIVLGIKSCIMG